MTATVADFRAVLSLWASGVSVVTSNDDGMLYGLTVSSFSSLSLDPPLVLVCLANTNRIVPMIEQSGGFAVSILASDQIGASNYFARAGRLPTTDFTEIEGEWSPLGQPVVAGALAWMTCALHATFAQGDHTIVIGRVNDTRVNAGKEPLLYWSRSYRYVGEIPPSAPSTPTRPVAWLELMSGPDSGRRFTLVDEVTVGRSDGSVVHVADDARLGDTHCRVERTADGYRLTDGGSEDGTVVNGSRVSTADLKGGDVILAGRTLFRFGTD